MDKRRDVVIIGGGIAGASLAYRLSQKDPSLKITVLDEGPAAGYGTERRPSATSNSAACVREQFDDPTEIAIAQRSIDFLIRIQEAGHDVGYTANGYLYLANDEETLATDRVKAALHNAHGVNTRILDWEQVREKVPMLDLEGIVGGRFNQRDGFVDPLALTGFFAREARKNGIEFKGSESVEYLHAEGGAIDRVVTQKGEVIRADKVVLAAGAYTTELARRVTDDGHMVTLGLPIRAFVRETVVLSVDGDYSNGASLKDHPMVIYQGSLDKGALDGTWAMAGEDVAVFPYWRPENGGHLLAGMVNPEQGPRLGRLDSAPQGDYRELAARISGAAEDVAPALASAHVVGGTRAHYCETRDHRPILDEVSQVKGLFVYTGFSGHGIMVAPEMSNIMSDIVLGRPNGFAATYSLGREMRQHDDQL